jgi:putative FmdB family regulatory protein
MPIYEYGHEGKRGRCRERVEVRQKMADAPVSECPLCGGAVRKLVSLPAGAPNTGVQPDVQWYRPYRAKRKIPLTGTTGQREDSIKAANAKVYGRERAETMEAVNLT